MTPGMAHGFQMAGRGMRQSGYFPEAPEVFSKFSDGLDHQATRFTDLPSPGLICMLASWKKGEGLILSLLVPTDSLRLGHSRVDARSWDS